MSAGRDVTRLVRNSRGGVHLAGCKFAGKTAVPWRWAEGRDDSEWKRIPWLHACKHCIDSPPLLRFDRRSDA